MTKIRDLHGRWSRDTDYKDAYDTLGEEFDLSFDLPVKSLAPGEYLITVEATAGEKSTQRALRCRVR